MKVKYTIAGRDYATKKEIVEHLHALKYRKASNQERAQGFNPQPRKLSDAETDWLIDVLRTFRPTVFREKCKGIFSHFELVQEPLHGGYHNDGYAYRGISIVRKDGTSTQISVTATKLNDKVNWKSNLIATLRHIVKFYIDREREKLRAQTNYCPITGEKVTSEVQMHLDHVDPLFSEIAEAWIKENNIEPSEDLFLPRKDSDMIYVLSSEELAMNFVNYHAMECTLMLVTASANLKKGSKKAA